MLIPSPPPLSIGETSPAALALLNAARKASEAGSFRVRVSASVQGTGPGQVIEVEGTGASESAARYQMHLSVRVAGKLAQSDALGYDGRLWTRRESGAWKPLASPRGGADPRSYLGFLRGATRVTDGGPDNHAGVDGERYTAELDLAAAGGAVPSGGKATSASLVSYVDRQGRLFAEVVMLQDASGGPAGTVEVVMSDFGARLTVVPPA